MLVESNTMMVRSIRLRSIAQPFHMRDWIAHRMTFKAQIWTAKAKPRDAGIDVRTISVSIGLSMSTSSAN